jgi:hypothetical protein
MTCLKRPWELEPWLYMRPGMQNPGSYQVEMSKSRMGIELSDPLNWGQFTHLWRDAIEAERWTLLMLERAFPVSRDSNYLF